MEELQSFNIEVNTSKQILSSETKIYKTERFFYQTKKLANIDKFVLKISESLISMVKPLADKFFGNEEVNCFKVDTFDKSFSFLVKFGFQLDEPNVKTDDIIFFADENNFENLKMNDQRVNVYLKDHKIFNVVLKPIYADFDESDFKKLYLLSNAEYVNFPMLNEKQQKLVEIQKKYEENQKLIKAQPSQRVRGNYLETTIKDIHEGIGNVKIVGKIYQLVMKRVKFTSQKIKNVGQSRIMYLH